MKLLPVAGDHFDPLQVVVLEVSESQVFIDRLRELVDAYERLLGDAMTYMPAERAAMPPIVPSDYFE